MDINKSLPNCYNQDVRFVTFVIKHQEKDSVYLNIYNKKTISKN